MARSVIPSKAIIESESRRASIVPPSRARSELKNVDEKISGSLIPQTLDEMKTDTEFQASWNALKEKGQKKLTARERKRREAALRHLGFKAGAFESKCPWGSLKRAFEP